MKDFNKLFIIIVICLISNITNASQLEINSQVQYIRAGSDYRYSKDWVSNPTVFNFPIGEKVTVMGEWVGTNIGLPFIFHPIYINNGGTINAQINYYWYPPLWVFGTPDYLSFEIEMENDLAKVYRVENNLFIPVKYRTYLAPFETPWNYPILVESSAPKKENGSAHILNSIYWADEFFKNNATGYDGVPKVEVKQSNDSDNKKNTNRS